MTSSLKALLSALAVALLAVAVLVPIAGASGSTPGGMMGSPSPWPTMMGTPTPSASPTMMGTPTPSPSPTGNTWGDSWCGGGMWGGSGSWGGTGMWGTGSGASWLTNNPDALAAWLQLKTDHVAAMQTWYDTYKADLTTPAAQQALHDLWTDNWNDMKAFYEKYGNGAAWTCPTAGMWGGWQGGMMGGSWDASHMWGSGYGASWMTGHARKADRRRHRLAAALRRQLDRQRGADGHAEHAHPYAHAGQELLSQPPPDRDHRPHALRRRRLDGPRRHVGRLGLVSTRSGAAESR
jgi:hypothetical protein